MAGFGVRTPMTGKSKTTAPASRLVCVINGDAGIRKKLGALLVRSQHETKSFASGDKFLAKLENLSPGCLIVGQNLPDQTGLEFMAELQNRGYSFPTILLSQKTNVSTAVRAIREGAADFVEIPWVDRNLLKTVDNLMQKQ
jgi:two-component system response regulator FixJ